MMRLGFLGTVLLTFVSSCTFDSTEHTGRVAIGLSGQLDPEDIEIIDIYIYEADDVSCDSASGSIAGDTSVAVSQTLGVAIAAGTTSLTMPTGSYVAYVEAGLGTAGAVLEQAVAQGCATVNLDSSRTLSVMLYPFGVCGNGQLDPREQCDEESDGCDRCTTVPQLVNTGDSFLRGGQSLPVAAGSNDEIAVCWRSDSSDSYQLPMALFNRNGRGLIETNPYRQTDSIHPRNCDSVAVREGTVVVVYEQDDGDLTNRPYFLSTWESGSVTPTRTEGFGDTGAAPTDVQVIFTGDDFGVLAAVEGDALRLYSFLFASSSGVGVSVQQYVRFATTDQTDPALAGRRDGGFLITWREGGSALIARQYRRPNEDHEWQVDLCDSGDGCGPPAAGSIRRDDGEHFLVAFRRGHAGPLMGVWISPDLTVSSPFAISEGEDCSEPDIAVLGDLFIVVWTQVVGGSKAVFARVVTGSGDSFGQMPTGTLTTTEPLRVSPSEAGDCDQPTVATPDGFPDASTALVFYRDGNGDGTNGPDISRRLLRVLR